MVVAFMCDGYSRGKGCVDDHQAIDLVAGLSRANRPWRWPTVLLSHLVERL